AAWRAAAAGAAVPDSLSAKAVAAAVSPGPVPAAVAALTHGVLRAMFIQKLNLVAVGGLLLAFACLAAWAATPQTAARETPTPTGAPVVFNQKPADDKKPAPAAQPAGPGKLLMMMDGRLLQYDPDGTGEKEIAKKVMAAAISPDGKWLALTVLTGYKEQDGAATAMYRAFLRPLAEKGEDLPIGDEQPM